MQSSCLELEEEQKRVEGTRMQRICLELEERRRVEGPRIQRSCLELDEEQKELREQVCREFA